MPKRNFYISVKTRHFMTVLLFLVLQINASAQNCGGCTTIISSNSSANITIGPSDVVCIDPGISVTGNITLNGGILCNRGMVSDLTLIEGSFFNYGSFENSATNLNITSAKNLRINCYENSNFNLKNTMNIDASSNTDSIMINVFKGAKFSIGANLSISKGYLKIRNAHYLGLESLPIQSYFNIGGQLNVTNSSLRILNNDYGIFNVNGAVNLEGKYSKTIFNYGLFSCNNSFNISGNGQNQYTTLIENKGTFNVSSHLTSSYNNGTVTINNNYFQVKPEPSFSIGGSLNISKNNNTFNNNTLLTVAQDVFLERGSLTNTKNIYVSRDVEIKNGSLTNDGLLIANRDFITSNGTAIVNNNYYINVGRNFENKGLLKLGQNSLFVTYNFNNTVNGYIDGPESIADPVDPTSLDETKYGLLVVTNNSDNYGYLRNHLSIVDITYDGTNALAIDDIHNSSAKIASTVVSKSANLPILIAVPLPFCAGMNLTTTPVTPITVCNGANVVITAQAKNFTFNVSPSSPGYNWNFMVTGAVISGPKNNTYSFPASTGITLPLTAVVLGCNLSLNVVVNVSNIVVNAGPDQIYVPPTNTTLGPATSSGGTGPYTYIWTPNTYFVGGNTGASPLVAPAVNILYTATATDANGCIGSDQVNVVSLVNNISYAVPRKNVDAGYHLAVNSKVYFKFEEEYRTSTLSYKIYEYNNVAPSTVACNSLNAAKNLGDNRYFIDFTTCGAMTAAKYYLLELINDKNEKFYLKFLR